MRGEGQTCEVREIKATCSAPTKADRFPPFFLFASKKAMEAAASAMVFDESEWILADSVVPEGFETDWVVTDGDEGSVSGVFYHPSAAGRRRICLSYASFGRLPPALPDPSLSFLPPAAYARSSSRGLLLLRGPWSTYYVCNPAAAESRRLPLPPRAHHFDPAPAVALVVRPDDPARFYVVCAIDAGDGRYRFEIFSSASAAWKASSAAAFANPVVPGSGVSAAGVAYWRTSRHAVLAYDPEADDTRVFLAPPGCEKAGERWQLGEAGGDGGLCCTYVTSSEVVVYALGPSDEWTLLGSIPLAVVGGEEAVEWESGDPIPCREPPRPLRFESTNLEVVLWVDGRVVAMDLETRRAREIRFDGPAPVQDDDYVSYISTVAPVAPVASG